jgi:hypothetical protein
MALAVPGHPAPSNTQLFLCPRGSFEMKKLLLGLLLLIGITAGTPHAMAGSGTFPLIPCTSGCTNQGITTDGSSNIYPNSVIVDGVAAGTKASVTAAGTNGTNGLAVQGLTSGTPLPIICNSGCIGSSGGGGVGGPIVGFAPNGTYAVLPTATSGQVALPSPGTWYAVTNNGTLPVWVNPGTSSAVTAAITNIQIPAGATYAFQTGLYTNLAGITSSGNMTVSIYGGTAPGIDVLGTIADAAWTTGSGTAIAILKAIDRDVNLGVYAQGSSTTGQSGFLNQYAVTTSPPTYTTGQTSPGSMDVNGNHRVSIGQGGNTAAVKAASTPAVVGDSAVVVAISPNNTVTTTSLGSYFTNVAGTTLTRASNTTAYAANETVCLLTSTTVCAPVTVSIATANGGKGIINRVSLLKSGSSTTNASFTIWLFSAAPGTATPNQFDATGYTGPRAADMPNYIGSAVCSIGTTTSDTTAQVWYDCALSNPNSAGALDFQALSGSTNIDALISVTAAYTPASAETFNVYVSGIY